MNTEPVPGPDVDPSMQTREPFEYEETSQDYPPHHGSTSPARSATGSIRVRLPSMSPEKRRPTQQDDGAQLGVLAEEDAGPATNSNNPVTSTDSDAGAISRGPAQF